MSHKQETFDNLVIGLAEYFNQNRKYPYPDLFRHAMNSLSLEMQNTFPKTITGLLMLLEEPMKDWYFSKSISEEFDADFGLIDEGSLSEEANNYLYEVLQDRGEIPEYASTKIKQIAIENRSFRKILNKLQDLYNNGEYKQAQQEYLIFRPFLIQNQYAIPRQFRKTFSRTRHIDIEEVGELYEECQENQTYWYCDRCGILSEKYGQLRGVKPSLCNDHRRDCSYVHRVNWEPGLRRIKPGIHLRVCLPGIPEINLYSALEKLRQEHPNYLREVNLYPGLDRYDLQLRFSDDSVWAIDIKDVRSPYKLAKKLVPLYAEGSLRYDESFYMISDRCLQNYPDYLEIARKEAKLPHTVHLLGDTVFKKRVITKIEQLK